MSRYRDHDQLDGGSALWKRADDEKFWLEGDSDDEEAEIGWTPGLKSDLNTNKNQKNKKQWIEEDDSEGDGASSSSEVDEGEEHDLLAGSAKAAGSNPPQKKREAWEKKWDDKFKALYDAIPRRKPQTQGTTLDLRRGPRSHHLSVCFVASADAAQFTDAILSCPGCFSVLCEMCQRHEVDFNRWRVQTRLALLSP